MRSRDQADIDAAAKILFDDTLIRLNDRLTGQIIELLHQRQFPRHIHMSSDIAKPYMEWRYAYYTYTGKFPRTGLPMDEDGYYPLKVDGVTEQSNLPPNSIYIDTGGEPPAYGPGSYRLLLTSDTK